VQKASDVDDPGELAITRVVFGDEDGIGGLVELKNVGAADVQLRRFKVCQPPECIPLEDVLEPGQVAWLTSSRIASLTREEGVLFVVPDSVPFRASSGEFALFGIAEDGTNVGIVSYVQWGTDDHGATQLAIDAGIWAAGAHVDSTDAYEIYGPMEQGTHDWEDWATLRSS